MISENIRLYLFDRYPEFKNEIEYKCKTLDRIYTNHLEETKFVYDSKLEGIESVLMSEEVIDDLIKFDKDYKNSDFGKGDHIVEYIGEQLENMILFFDRKQNLKDFDDK